MRELSAAKQERLRQLTHGLVLPVLPVEEKRCACPVCSGPTVVQKTVSRQGRTLLHGAFKVRETVHECAAGCHQASGARVTRRAACLGEWLLPRSTVGYDVMVFIGKQRFIEHRQREETKAALRDRYGLDLSTGEISRLGRLFLDYLQRLHDARSAALRSALASNGGWPMHIDATGEDGRGTLLVVMAGWRHWVLGGWKIPTERTEAILPHLRDMVTYFGPPCAIMRDLGRAMRGASNALADEIAKASGQKVRLLACHLHFLADVGKGLLEPAHDGLRNLFRRCGIRPGLRTLARDLGLRLGRGIGTARADLAAWQEVVEEGHRLPVGAAGVAVVRGLAQWVLDYEDDGRDQGFPFDRPYLDLYHRCVTARRAADAFLCQPPADPKVVKALNRLRTVLDPVVSENAFAGLAQILACRVGLFEELRAALRLVPKPSGRRDDPAGQSAVADTTPAELDAIKTAVEKLTRSLRERRPQRGPAKDARQAIDLVLRHLSDHGDYLWDRAVQLPREAGGGVRLVDRTNNLLEGYFHAMKHGERRRSGRKILTADFESLPPAAALVPNLAHPDYVAIVCGTLDNLPRAFAQLDADTRDHGIADATGDRRPPPAEPPASASLPREDRIIIRSDAMRRRILAAAHSRAPRNALPSKALNRRRQVTASIDSQA